MDESKRLRALLDERGIEHVDADDGHTQHTWWSDGDHEIGACDSGERLAVYNLTPEQAIAATVGNEPWEPSKEWKAWHASLRHDNPTNVREVAESILFDAIEFGGDMGPNGNVCSGVDEGDVLTNGCIDGWVKSIEAIAAMVTTEPDEATMLKLHGRMNAALLDYESAMGIDGGNGANTVPFVVEMHKIIEDAATVGVGTCQIEERHGDWYCTGCGEMVGACDPASELCIDGNAIELWRHCPNCGREITE